MIGGFGTPREFDKLRDGLTPVLPRRLLEPIAGDVGGPLLVRILLLPIDGELGTPPEVLTSSINVTKVNKETPIQDFAILTHYWPFER